MGTQDSEFNTEELASVTRNEMIQHGLISHDEQIALQPHHWITMRGKQRSHYIVSCLGSGKRFFLKVKKGNDAASHCNAFLQRFQAADGSCGYPLLASPEFSFYDNVYNIYTFAEGETLEHLLERYPTQVCGMLADKLSFRLGELHSVHAPQCSDQNRFVSEGCADILKKKILPRLKHPIFSDIPPATIAAVYHRCAEILDGASFSPPTLLHMDIKPANIIYEEQTQTLSLIDFELARFGDSDYGWTQILLTELKPYGDTYKKYFLPALIRNGLALEDALQLPKFQCYAFYQSACNLIYYYEHKEPYPEELRLLFFKLLTQLSK